MVAHDFCFPWSDEATASGNPQTDPSNWIKQSNNGQNKKYRERENVEKSF